MKAFVWAVVWGLIGLVGGYVATVAIGVVLFDIFKVSQREGAAAMGLAFVIGPFVACIVALSAAVTAGIIISRRERLRADGAMPPPRPMARGVKAAIGGLLGAIGGYGGAVLLLAAFYAFRGSPYFSSYAWAYAAAWAPFVAAALCGGLGIWLALRARGADEDGVSLS